MGKPGGSLQGARGPPPSRAQGPGSLSKMRRRGRDLDRGIHSGNPAEPRAARSPCPATVVRFPPAPNTPRARLTLSAKPRPGRACAPPQTAAGRPYAGGSRQGRTTRRRRKLGTRRRRPRPVTVDFTLATHSREGLPAIRWGFTPRRRRKREHCKRVTSPDGAPETRRAGPHALVTHPPTRI